MLQHLTAADADKLKLFDEAAKLVGSGLINEADVSKVSNDHPFVITKTIAEFLSPS